MSPKQLLAYFDRIAEAPGAVPRLRRFVRELAVRGKLVEQDPSEEPAATLLIQLRARQREMLSARAFERLSEDGSRQSIPIPFPLAVSWEVAPMAQLAVKLGAGSTPLGGKSVYVQAGVPFVRSQNVYNDGLRLDDVAYISSAVHQRMSGSRVEPQDILLNITGASIGRSAVVSEDLGEANVSQHVAIVRLFLPVLRHFVHLVLTSPSYQQLIDSVQVGVSRAGLSMERLRLFAIPLPPLAEQHRIVTKVDELMTLCDRLEAAQAERERRRSLYTRAAHRRVREQARVKTTAIVATLFPQKLAIRPEQLPVLRHTILRLAVQGKLGTTDAADEPARKLLGARELRIESEDAPWQPPQGWAWSSLALIGDPYGGGTPSKGNADFWKGRIPWVSPKDMKVDRIADAEDHISEEAIENSAAKLIPAGALLMVVRGMILAHSFPTAVSRVPVAINQDMKAVLPFCEDITDFLSLLTKAMRPEVLRLVKRSTHGTCKLLTNELFSLPLPIPPLAEQRRILAKVDELFSVVDRLETQLAAERDGRSRLLEAVLRRALTGSTEQVAAEAHAAVGRA